MEGEDSGEGDAEYNQDVEAMTAENFALLLGELTDLATVKSQLRVAFLHGHADRVEEYGLKLMSMGLTRREVLRLLEPTDAGRPADDDVLLLRGLKKEMRSASDRIIHELQNSNGNGGGRNSHRRTQQQSRGRVLGEYYNADDEN